MAHKKKIRVAVLYGGRSGEHEVSLRSAASVIHHLSSERYEIVPIGIDKQGRWHLNDLSLIENAGAVLPMDHSAPTVMLPPNPPTDLSAGSSLVPMSPMSGGKAQGIDVVFPVMHGTFCEDGTIQGLLELADVPYVGCGVLASAVGMDKEVAKRLMRDAGIPIVPFLTVRASNWPKQKAAIATKVASDLGYPCFVKPANAGSSVGVHKVKQPTDLEAALTDALRYDSKVLVEKAISAREIEMSVLENSDHSGLPLVSIPGEVTPTHEFYSYESKYLDENGAVIEIPAKLAPEQIKAAQSIARDAFMALECEGLSRVDLFLDKVSGTFYFNEINTLPGFTSISMYPKMWEASGIAYSELLSRLVDLAIARHERKQKLVRDFKA